MKRAISLIIGLLVLVGLVGYVAAQVSIPRGVEEINDIHDETASDWNPKSNDAEAGNITTLTINGSSQTMTWQGYVGNISGLIVLDDADNYTLYNWQEAEPQGELYASTKNSITWTAIKCWNATNSLSGAETTLGLQSNDADGIDETFDLNTAPVTYVGSVTIDDCNSTRLFESDEQSAAKWWEMLLEDGDGTIIYTSIIEDDTIGQRDGEVGFDGQDYDFQMIVGEDGHDGDDTATPYYFWSELE